MEQERKLQTNLDTDFLKLIAIIAMLLDHVGNVFFPQYPIFRWIGRIACPIFCYCMTVGLLYTHDIKKYLTRLGIFAIISQPFWILAFNPDDVWGNLTNWNIFFTLFLSLLSLWAFQEKKWWLFALGVVALALGGFDYNYNGLVMMLIFLLCRNKPGLGALLYFLTWIPALWGGDIADPRCPVIAGHAINWTIFGLGAMPFIFLNTHTNLRVPKWFFYGFYPAHLAAIALVRFLMKV